MAGIDFLKKGNADRIKTLNNKVFDGKKSLKNLSWIKTERIKIDKLIESYDNINTKKSMYSALAVVYRDVLKDDVLQKEYGDKATALNKVNLEMEEKQQLDTRELQTYQTWNSIMKIRHTLKIQFERNSNNKQANYKYLIVCLYTLQPPIRSEYHDIRITKKVIKNAKYNHAWFDSNGVFNVQLNDFKTIKKMGPQTLVFSPELSNIVKISLEKHPRKWLLANRDDSDAMPLATFKKYLLEIGVGIDNFRSACITHFYKNHESIKDRKDLARLMLHDMNTATLNYQKILPIEADEKDWMHNQNSHKLFPDRYRHQGQMCKCLYRNPDSPKHSRLSSHRRIIRACGGAPTQSMFVSIIENITKFQPIE